MTGRDRYLSLLVRLAPSPVRDRHGAELLALLQTMKAQVGSSPGPLRLLRFYVAVTWDAVRPAVAWRAALTWDRLTQDARYGFRALLRDRGFSFAAVAILTLGIGANAVVFTLAERVLLDEPPEVAEPSDLVSLTWTENEGWSSWSYVDYAFVRERVASLSGVLAYMPYVLAVSVESAEGGAQADAWVVSDNYFDVLGVPMALGRGFLPDEGRALGTHPVVVLSHGFWERAFGSEREVVGRPVRLNGTTFTVVGVTPQRFRGTSPVEPPPDLYVPLMMQGAIVAGAEAWFERVDGDRNTWLRVIGRLREGATAEAARSNIEGIEAAWSAEYGAWADATDLPEFRLGATGDYRFVAEDGEQVRRMLGFLLVVVAAVLLIACANLALLLLARAPKRRGELGVRAALGASRGRMVGQLLVEGALLSAAGGAGGLLVSSWAVPALASLMPYSFSSDLRVDATAFTFVAAVTLGITLLFGLVPALRASRVDLGGMLASGGRVTSRAGARNALVVAQVAVSVVLVAGAGLFVRSLVAARAVDLGFDPADRLVMSVALDNHGYDEVRGRAFVEAVVERVRALPEVELVSTTARPPFSGRWQSGVRFEGAPDDAPTTILSFNRAGPDYFATMGIPIVAGRAISSTDAADAPPVLVVSRAAAQQLWPGRDAVGRSIEWRSRSWTVVGVATDARQYALGERPASLVYVPPAQDYDGRMTFVVHTSVPAADLAPSVQSIIRDIDDAVAVFGIQTLEDLTEAQMSSYRALAVLVSAFGGIALLLAAVGLYGVLAYLVSQSFREIGIRMALGARADEVVAAILQRGAALAALGTALGLAVAWVSAGVVRQMLFGVAPRDPLTLAVVAGILLTVTTVASYLPARRAARVDPVTTLRDA